MTDERDKNEDSQAGRLAPLRSCAPGHALTPRPGDLTQPSERVQRAASVGRSSTWSVVLRAQGGGPRARAALGELIGRYERTVTAMVRAFWHPWNITPEELKQEFFRSVIERGDIEKLDRTRGESFRGWLSVAVKHFLLNEKQKWLAQKRGNRVTAPLPFQVLHGVTPELLFDRQFAEDTVLHALARHREETKDKARFDLWARVLPGPQLDIPDLAELAAAFRKTPNGLAVEICRLRKRHKRILREIVADTLDLDANDPAADRTLELELSLLYRALCAVPRMHVVLEDA